MSGTQSWAPPDSGVARQRRGLDRAFDFCRTVIWVYGGFLLGMLAHAAWVDDENLVFWPWSLVFLLMLVGLVGWQRRRPVSVSSTSPEGHSSPR